MESDFENKIVHHDFRQRKTDQGQGSQGLEDFENVTKKILTVDFGQTDAATQDTSFASLFTKFEKIQSLRATSASLRTNRELIASYTLDDIVGWLTRATDSEISSKPGFYMALMDKYFKLMGL